MQREFNLRILQKYLIGVALLLTHSKVTYLIATRIILLNALVSVSYWTKWDLNLLGCT